jgi:hypothetical protein
MTSSAVLSQAWTMAKTEGPGPPIPRHSFLWAVLSPDPDAAEAEADVGDGETPAVASDAA